MCRCRTSLWTHYGGIYSAMPCPRTAYCSRRRQAYRLTLRRSTISCISTRGVQVCRPVGCTSSLADPFRVCLTALRACAPTCGLLKQRGGTVIFCAADTRCRQAKNAPPAEGNVKAAKRQKKKETVFIGFLSADLPPWSNYRCAQVGQTTYILILLTPFFSGHQYFPFVYIVSALKFPVRVNPTNAQTSEPLSFRLKNVCE